MNFEQSAGGVLMPADKLSVGGVFAVDHIRKGEVIDREEIHNLVVNEGLDHVLNTIFHGGTQIGTWYLGLFEGNYTPAANVTAATITSASTESTAYDEATRPEYKEAAASSQSITNAANKATFTFNADKTIYGAFLVSSATKGSTSGTLFSAARFNTAKLAEDDDQLLLTYTFTASSI